MSGKSADDPRGEHDPEALEEAEEKMHAEGEQSDQETVDDPTGGHDKKALEEGAERMHARP